MFHAQAALQAAHRRVREIASPAVMRLKVKISLLRVQGSAGADEGFVVLRAFFGRPLLNEKEIVQFIQSSLLL